MDTIHPMHPTSLMPIIKGPFLHFLQREYLRLLLLPPRPIGSPTAFQETNVRRWITTGWITRGLIEFRFVVRVISHLSRDHISSLRLAVSVRNINITSVLVGMAVDYILNWFGSILLQSLS
jgi:hypothetical protein